MSFQLALQCCSGLVRRPTGSPLRPLQEVVRAAGSLRGGRPHRWPGDVWLREHLHQGSPLPLRRLLPLRCRECSDPRSLNCNLISSHLFFPFFLLSFQILAYLLPSFLFLFFSSSIFFLLKSLPSSSLLLFFFHLFLLPFSTRRSPPSSFFHFACQCFVGVYNFSSYAQSSRLVMFNSQHAFRSFSCQDLASLSLCSSFSFPLDSPGSRFSNTEFFQGLHQ